MELKYYFDYKGLHLEFTATNDEERKEVTKAIKYAIKDLKEVIDTVCPDIIQTIPESNIPVVPVENNQVNQVVTEFASEGQIRYMNKLGIEYPENCTKIQAIDLISEYKQAHGWKK